MKLGDQREIGRRVRVARRALKLRQTDLADMAGLPASHLSDIERGALTPTIPTLRKLGEALERPLEYLLPAAEAEPRSLGMVVQASSIGEQAAARFAELIEEKTGGELKVRVYHHWPAGSVREQVAGLAEGAIDIYADELLNFECFAELVGPVCLPFFFRDREHYQRFLESPIFEEHVYQKLLDSGIRLLKPVPSWECGSFEVLLSTDPIFAPEDLLGRKFRSYESKVAIALRRALGAEPVVVEWLNAPQSFESGLIDTFLIPAAYLNTLLQTRRFARYVMLLDYGYTLNSTVAVSEREYRQRSPDVQAVLEEASLEAAAFCTRLANEQAEIALERLSDEYGLPVIYPDRHAWRESFQAAIRQICEDEGLLSRSMYEALQSL